MTIVRGRRICQAPCCGAQYAFPNYRSMNFGAIGHWTDGWRDVSLMPNDEGLRQCRCGRYLLLEDLVHICTVDSSDLPWMARVEAQSLPQCIAEATDEAVEVAARLGYWRYLNHGYRNAYRTHRDAEDARTQALWEAAHPDTRSRCDRLLGRRAPVYRPSADRLFTYPPFEPDAQQTDNMRRLAALLQQRLAQGRAGLELELTELLRELGRFEEAAAVLTTVEDGRSQITIRLLRQLLDERETAPMRYRM